MKQPHKHAEVIRAYADGATIEYRPSTTYRWETIETPHFDGEFQYRVKPEPEFPKCSLHYQTLCDIWNSACDVKGGEGSATRALRMCADAAIKEFIVSGEAEAYFKSVGKGV